VRVRTSVLSGPEIIACNASPGSLSLGMALLMALSARLSFMTPLSPVPVTLQVAAVLLAGFLLGPRFGLLSVVFYICAGILGAPVFAMGMGGPGIVMQPSFGYILAFPLAAWIVGALAERSPKSILRGLLISCAGILVIYATGAAWLAGYMISTGASLDSAVTGAYTAGIAPFLLVDGLKGMLVAGIWAAYRSEPGK